MSTVQAFNTLLKSFLEELNAVFPEEKQISAFLGGFDVLAGLSPRGPLDAFMDALEPHSALVAARDPSLFGRLRFPGGIDFAALWAREGVTDATRQAIWSYIESLSVLGTMVRSVPQDMLQQIEGLAEGLAGSCVTESGGLDFASLGNLLLNNGALGTLIAGLGAGGGLSDAGGDDRAGGSGGGDQAGGSGGDRRKRRQRGP